MRYKCCDKEFIAYTQNELVFKASEISGEPICTTRCPNSNYFDTIGVTIVSDNPDIVRLLNFPFNIPTDHNFANRSARAFCVDPNKYFHPEDPNCILSFGDYFVCLFRSIIEHITSNRTYRQYFYRYFEEEVENHIYAISKTIQVMDKYRNLLETYSKQAKWCDIVTSRNINHFFMKNGIVDQNGHFSRTLLVEMGIIDLDLIRKLFKSEL